MKPVDLAALLNRPANRPAKRPASAVSAAPAPKKPSACQIVIDDSDVEDLLEREIDGRAGGAKIHGDANLQLDFNKFQIFFSDICHFYLGNCCL